MKIQRHLLLLEIWIKVFMDLGGLFPEILKSILKIKKIMKMLNYTQIIDPQEI